MGKTARLGVGALHIGVSALVGWGVFVGLPARWWPVDAGALALIVALSVSGASLLSDHPRKVLLTRVASALSLALGLAVFAALAITASWLSGVYGPIGKGGAAIFALTALLVLPYLVVLPAAVLVWLHALHALHAPHASPSGDDEPSA